MIDLQIKIKVLKSSADMSEVDICRIIDYGLSVKEIQKNVYSIIKNRSLKQVVCITEYPLIIFGHLIAKGFLSHERISIIIDEDCKEYKFNNKGKLCSFPCEIFRTQIYTDEEMMKFIN